MAAHAPSRAIIDLDAYAHNLGVVRAMTPNECRIMAVVKSDAYGHGITRIAERAVREKAAMLGVATIEEAITLRERGITAPILVMIEPDAGSVAAATEFDLRLMISDVAIAEKIGEQARRANRVVPVHCKVDTGMGRQGFDIDTAADEMLFLTRISHIDIEGIATHFPRADDARDALTANQIRAFRAFLKTIDKRGIPYEMAHASNSAGIVNFPSGAFDMVRPGLMTYGVWPSQGDAVSPQLRPVLRWETKVRLIRTLKPGATIGYGNTFTARTTIRVALLPCGYADGYMHALGNRAEVLIRGQRCRVRGAVSMDQILVDVSHIPDASVDDTAVLIGKSGAETISAEELAVRADTIPYEILTRIGPRVERVYAPHGS